MVEQLRGITWEALEHHHGEKRSDWFWALGIITIGATTASIMFGNTLLGIVILISGIVMSLLALREAKVVPYAVTLRGVRVEERLYPYSTLESFYIDEEDPFGPQLLVKSEKMFMPLIVMPIPEEYIDDIEEILASRLPEEHLEEPLAHKLLEFFGF